MDITTDYVISVKTSDAYAGSGTNSSVFLNLIGEDGKDSTGYLEIDNFFTNDFERGQLDRFKFNAKDVGLPIAIGIKLQHFLVEDQWYCEYIRVNTNNNTVLFPVYDWVQNEVFIAQGTGSLPQKAANYLKQLRVAEVAKNRVRYPWVSTPTKIDLGWDLPRFINASSYEELPTTFKRKEVRQENVLKGRSERRLDMLISLIKTKFYPITDFDSFHALSRRETNERQSPYYTENWETDESMGRQVLTGIDPLTVSRCTKIPEYFNVTNEDVYAFLENATLLDEIKAGKCYIADFTKSLDGLTRNVHLSTKEKLYCPNSIGLFHVNSKGQFLPIAIQLIPGDRDFLFTPADRKEDWLLAKMYFRCSCMSRHEWYTHLFLTHVVMEPISLSFFRCFPRAHPVYKLMKPHLQTVAAINTEGRKTLIDPGSPVNGAIGISSVSSLRAAFKTFTLEDLMIPQRLKKQGTDNPSLLPNFYYREDALMHWRIMEKYVNNTIRHYYKSDEDVCEDYELQGFAQDAAKEGLGWQDNNTRGMPEKITSVAQLVQLCIAMMFTSSVQHAAVNFGQFETYKFAPNSPSSMRLPPHKKGEATQKRIMDSLPDEKVALMAIALSYTLSSFSTDEVYLGQFPERHFCEEAILKIQEDYRNQLEEVGEKIRERNAELIHPYTWLLPDRVPNSISI